VLGPRLLITLTVIEELVNGFEDPFVHSHQIVSPDKEIHFAGPAYALALIENRQMHDDKKVIIVLINLGTLDPQAVLQIQRVEIKVTLQYFNVFQRRPLDVGPGDLAIINCLDSHPRLLVLLYHYRLFGENVKRLVTDQIVTDLPNFALSLQAEAR
jgi:hypothetical protein